MHTSGTIILEIIIVIPIIDATIADIPILDAPNIA